MLPGSFRTRIASVVILLLLVVIGALYFAVQAATDAAVRSQTGEQLDAGARVFGHLLDRRGRQLHGAVQALAADPGLKTALASGDSEAIRAVLASHGARVDAGAVMLLDLDGRLALSTERQIDGQTARRLSSRLMAGQGAGVSSVLMPVAGGIYLLVQAAVAAPLPVGWVLMGVRLDQALVRELGELTLLELTLFARQEGLPVVWVSSLPVSSRGGAQADLALEHSTAGDLRRIGAERYLERRLVLASGDDFQVEARLYKSLSPAQRAFAPLDWHILAIALSALLAALGSALLLARTLSQPLRHLAAAAERVGQGDYQVPLELHRSDELDGLAKAFHAMQQGIAERERQLAHNALHDALTGLPNRILAQEWLGSAIAAGRPTALLYVGVGNLRALNDSCGPGSSDLALQQLSQRLQASLRPGDSLAQLMTSELLLLLENSDGDSAVAVGDRLQQLLSQPLRIGNQEVVLDCCVGIATYPADGETPDDLLRRASIAMQDAAQLPGRLQMYEVGRDAAHQRQIGLIRDLRLAPANAELLLHYQPKLDIAAGQVRQAEALLRWRHPQLGMIAPGEFIPLAERTGSIQSLTAWMLEESLRQLREWNGRGLRMQLSLNISTEDLVDAKLPTRVEQMLMRYQVPAEQLIFEITESGVMVHPALALQVLHELRELGISLSVDDFGTGYSSLTQLKRMPVQELKIDQSFICDLDDASEDAVIVRSTIEMSHSLGLKVVAEGVELACSLRLLEHWQCDYAQGHLISRPLPAEAFEAWLAQPLKAPVLKTS